MVVQITTLKIHILSNFFFLNFNTLYWEHLSSGLERKRKYLRRKEKEKKNAQKFSSSIELIN